MMLTNGDETLRNSLACMALKQGKPAEGRYPASQFIPLAHYKEKECGLCLTLALGWGRSMINSRLLTGGTKGENQLQTVGEDDPQRRHSVLQQYILETNQNRTIYLVVT